MQITILLKKILQFNIYSHPLFFAFSHRLSLVLVISALQKSGAVHRSRTIFTLKNRGTNNQNLSPSVPEC